MNRDSHNPLGIVIHPEDTSAEGRKRHPGTPLMGATVGLLAVKPTGCLALIAFVRRLSKGVLGKIAMGVFCTAIYQAIMNFPAFWHGVKVLCAFVGLLGDARIVRQATDLLSRGGEVARQHTITTDVGEDEKPTVKQRLKSGLTKAKEATKEVAHNTAEAVEEKVKPIEKDARQAVDEIKERLGKPPHPPEAPTMPGPRGWMTAPLTSTSGPLPPGMGPTGGSPPAGGFKRGVQNFGNSVVELGHSFAAGAADAQAEQALYLRWWAENCPFTGRCPRRHPMNVPAHAKKNYCCSQCGKASSYPAALIRLNGPPGPPPVKPRAFYAWKEQQEKKLAEEAKVAP